MVCWVNKDLKEVTQNALTIKTYEDMRDNWAEKKDYSNLVWAVLYSYTLPGAVSLVEKSFELIKDTVKASLTFVALPILLPASFCNSKAWSLVKDFPSRPVFLLKEVCKLPKHVLQMIPIIGVFLARAYAVTSNYLKHKVASVVNYIAHTHAKLDALTRLFFDPIMKEQSFQIPRVKGQKFDILISLTQAEKRKIKALIEDELTPDDKRLVQTGLGYLYHFEQKRRVVFNDMTWLLDQFNEERDVAEPVIFQSDQAVQETNLPKDIAIEKIRLWFAVVKQLSWLREPKQTRNENAATVLVETMKKCLLEVKNTQVQEEEPANQTEERQIEEANSLPKMLLLWSRKIFYLREEGQDHPFTALKEVFARQQKEIQELIEQEQIALEEEGVVSGASSSGS